MPWKFPRENIIHLLKLPSKPLHVPAIIIRFPRNRAIPPNKARIISCHERCLMTQSQFSMLIKKPNCFCYQFLGKIRCDLRDRRNDQEFLLEIIFLPINFGLIKWKFEIEICRENCRVEWPWQSREEFLWSWCKNYRNVTATIIFLLSPSTCDPTSDVNLPNASGLEEKHNIRCLFLFLVFSLELNNIYSVWMKRKSSWRNWAGWK